MVVLGGVLASGCSHSSFRVNQGRQPTMPSELAADFAYTHSAELTTRISVLETKPEYQIKRVSLQVWDQQFNSNRWIELDYYDLVDNSKPTPVILVLPMLGGGYALERHFANYFATRGYASIIVRRDKRSKGAGVNDLNWLFRDMVIDHKRVIDWVETQSDLDAKRLGIFGISMGGIKGALLLPLENRIRAAALGLTGGDLPYIMAHSTEPGVAKRREQEEKEAKKAAKHSASTQPASSKNVEKGPAAKPAPLNVDPSTGKSKEQRLAELLDAYKRDAITAEEYHRLRAKLLAEP